MNECEPLMLESHCVLHCDFTVLNYIKYYFISISKNSWTFTCKSKT